MLQLLVQLDKVALHNLLPYNDQTKLVSIDMHWIAWCDEKYTKETISSTQDRRAQTKFYRDRNFRLDPNGKLVENKHILHMKYSEEVWFCFGTCVINNEGILLPLFEHVSNKVAMHCHY